MRTFALACRSATRQRIRASLKDTEERRAFAEILSRIGDKWTVLVVGVLSLGPMRYRQIFKLVEGVSQRMLTLTLKSLARDGLVTGPLGAAEAAICHNPAAQCVAVYPGQHRDLVAGVPQQEPTAPCSSRQKVGHK